MKKRKKENQISTRLESGKKAKKRKEENLINARLESEEKKEILDINSYDSGKSHESVMK